MILRGGRRDIVQDKEDEADGQHGLFEVYREEFEGVWTDSRPVS